MGKTIKRYHYMPILDDRNIADQGLDASGAYTANDVTITITTADGEVYYANGVGADSSAALTQARYQAHAIICKLRGYNPGSSGYDTYAEVKALVIASGVDWTVSEAAAIPKGGNLYGSSKDIGYITGKLPTLTESGGRVNRVGMTRINLEGTVAKFGFFDEYTQESLDFDTDSELLSHITSECLKAANEITEDQLQIDLINGAGVVRYAGNATSTATVSGESTADEVAYDDLVKLAIELDNNRCPKSTKIISGSRMIDTKVINAARYIFIGSELQPSVMRMTDYQSAKAFVPVAQYAEAGQVANGEFGAIDNFRFIVHPEMMHWAASGASVSAAYATYRWSNNSSGSPKYDVFPMLVVGDGAFTHVGFQTDGKNVKFKIKHVKPEDNYSSSDPYGETGFYSIKWYYGIMILRPERIALLKTVARL